MTDNELRLLLQGTSATPVQVQEAVALDADGRLRALRASFLIVGGISLLAIFPAERQPKYAPGGAVCRGHRERDQYGGAVASLNGHRQIGDESASFIAEQPGKASCARFSRLFGLRGPTIHAEGLPVCGSKVSGEGELFGDRDELAVAALRGLAQEPERFNLIDLQPFHEDALGLADDIPVDQRGPQVDAVAARLHGDRRMGGQQQPTHSSSP